MKPIQPILLSLLDVIVISYLARVKTRIWDRVVVLAIGTAAAILVAQPDWANTLAAAVGVGRGVDVVLYLGFLGFLLLFLMIYVEMRNLRWQLTVVVREMALHNARAASEQMPAAQPGKQV